jgi:hypothetical protein
MAKGWKGKTSGINRDSGSPKARASRLAKLKGLRYKEGVASGEKSAFDDVVKVAKIKKTKVKLDD